jgi:hypothetical protein
MMRYTIFVFALYFFTACTVPPQSPPPVQTSVPAPMAILPEIEVHAERETPLARKPARKVRLSAAPCAGIDTGNETKDVRAKLDCLERK